ncbi:MAG: hypothetical protein IPN29_08525 [Saprospiraceae bacterium]|nr:hypothetical protein [Saprospiraceae bacterium]
MASEGIDAQTWQCIKLEEPNKLELLVSSFSDGVWRKIFSNQKYMRHETEEFIFLFDFQENSREVLRISKQTPNEIGHQVTPYRRERAREMFEAAEAGACFSSGQDFKQACLLWASGQKP